MKRNNWNFYYSLDTEKKIFIMKRYLFKEKPTPLERIVGLYRNSCMQGQSDLLRQVYRS